MSPDQVERSYRVDRSWRAIWEYTFGLRDYTDEEMELTRATYDATILELDDHLRSLIGTLEAAGRLENTVVVLTSDHGEHLGEHHMLDHQYSVYQPLIHVPLVVHYPRGFPAGRDDRPVAHYDLFPTLLGLTGTAPPPGLVTRAVDLRRAPKDRVRWAEDPSSSELGVEIVKAHHPGWDPSPWQRRLRTVVTEERKYILGSDDRDELYDLPRDPLEMHDLAAARGEERRRLRGILDDFAAGLTPCEGATEEEGPTPTEAERELLRSLGYVR
jgi:arylsulfatase A-like enzyme